MEFDLEKRLATELKRLEDDARSTSAERDLAPRPGRQSRVEQFKQLASELQARFVAEEAASQHAQPSESAPGRRSRVEDILESALASLTATAAAARASLASSISQIPWQRRSAFDDFKAAALRDTLLALGQVRGKRTLQQATLFAAADRPAAAGKSAARGQALWRATERRAATLYRHAVDQGEVPAEDPIVDEALARAGSGSALPAHVRAEMEAELGFDLSRVRVHTDATATAAARAVRAQAFTVGEDIFFSEHAFAPETREGKKLLAHELAHVVQAWQGRTATGGTALQVSQPHESLELEAEAIATRIDAQPRAVTHAPLAVPTRQRGEVEAAPRVGGPPRMPRVASAPAPASRTLMRRAQSSSQPSSQQSSQNPNGARPERGPNGEKSSKPQMRVRRDRAQSKRPDVVGGMQRDAAGFAQNLKSATGSSVGQLRKGAEQATRSPVGKKAKGKTSETKKRGKTIARQAKQAQRKLGAKQVAGPKKPTVKAPDKGEVQYDPKSPIQFKKIDDWSKYMPDPLPDQDEKERKRIEALVKKRVNGERAQSQKSLEQLRKAQLKQAAQVRAMAPGLQGQIASAQAAALGKVSAAESQQCGAISSHVAMVQGQVAGAAAAAKGQIAAAHATTMASIVASTVQTITSLTTAMTTANSSIDAAETAQLAVVRILFMTTQQSIRAVGAAKASEASALGTSHPLPYDGDKLDAARDAAKDVAAEYAKAMPEEAGKAADQIGAEQPKTEADVRKIAADMKKQVRQVFTETMDVVRTANQQAVEGANQIKTQMSAAVDATAAATSAGLAAHGASQVAAVRSAAAGARGGITKAGAAAKAGIAQAVAKAAAGIEKGVAGICKGAREVEAPNPEDTFKRVAEGVQSLGQGSQQIGAGLKKTAAQSSQGMATQAAGAASGMAATAASAKQAASAMGQGATQSMQQMAQGASQSLAQLAQQHGETCKQVLNGAKEGFTNLVKATTDAYREATTGLRQGLGDAVKNVEKGLNDAVPTKEIADIEKNAKQAADAVKPWWQKALAFVVSIVVAIVVVVVVTALIVTTGPVGAILVGALGGALGSVLGQMASNLVLGNGLMDGITWQSVAMGAIGGALGGGLTGVLGRAGGALGGSARFGGTALGRAGTAVNAAASGGGNFALRVGLNVVDEFVTDAAAQLIVTGKYEFDVTNLVTSIATNSITSTRTFEAVQSRAVQGIQNNVPHITLGGPGGVVSTGRGTADSVDLNQSIQGRHYSPPDAGGGGSGGGGGGGGSSTTSTAGGNTAGGSTNTAGANTSSTTGSANTSSTTGGGANTSSNTGGANTSSNTGGANTSSNTGGGANTSSNTGGANTSSNTAGANTSSNTGGGANTSSNTANTTSNQGGSNTTNTPDATQGGGTARTDSQSTPDTTNTTSNARPDTANVTPDATNQAGPRPDGPDGNQSTTNQQGGDRTAQGGDRTTAQGGDRTTAQGDRNNQGSRTNNADAGDGAGPQNQRRTEGGDADDGAPATTNANDADGDGPVSAQDGELNALGYPEGTKAKQDAATAEVESGNVPSKDNLRDTEANARGREDLQALLDDPNLTPQERILAMEQLADRMASRPDPTGNLAGDIAEIRVRIEAERAAQAQANGSTQPGPNTQPNGPNTQPNTQPNGPSTQPDGPTTNGPDTTNTTPDTTQQQGTNNVPQSDPRLQLDTGGRGLAEGPRMEGFTSRMRELEANWAGMTPGDRKAALESTINQSLADAGLPPIRINDNSPAGTNGTFDMTTWSINMSADLVNTNTPNMQAMADTLFHEARHAEQWYQIARHMHSEGVSPADIAARTFMPQDMVDAAVGDPRTRTPEQIANGRTWYESVYGTGRPHREATLNGMSQARVDLDTARTNLQQAAQANAAAEVHANATYADPAATQAQKDQAYQDWVTAHNNLTNASTAVTNAQATFDTHYNNYRNLPEEVDAWNTGNAAGDSFANQPPVTQQAPANPPVPTGDTPTSSTNTANTDTANTDTANTSTANTSTANTADTSNTSTANTANTANTGTANTGTANTSTANTTNTANTSTTNSSNDGSTNAPQHAPNTGPVNANGEPVRVIRMDNDFDATTNHKGQQKPHFDGDGNLTPANPTGNATVLEHVIGRSPHKDDSPYTSFASVTDTAAKPFGGNQIQLDTVRLQADIDAGRVQGVEILSPDRVQAILRAEAETVLPGVDAAAAIANGPRGVNDYLRDNHPGLSNTQRKKAADRLVALANSTRDGEWLIKGVIPHTYFTAPAPVGANANTAATPTPPPAADTTTPTSDGTSSRPPTPPPSSDPSTTATTGQGNTAPPRRPPSAPEAAGPSWMSRMMNRLHDSSNAPPAPAPQNTIGPQQSDPPAIQNDHSSVTVPIAPTNQAAPDPNNRFSSQTPERHHSPASQLPNTQSTTSPSTTATQPTTTPTTTTTTTPTAKTGSKLDDKGYLKDITFLEGGQSINAQAQTSQAEADILNGVRNDSRKFNPKFMVKLQDALGVNNKSGAFNTETLRKIIANPSIGPGEVTVESLLAGQLLTRLVPNAIDDETQQPIAPIENTGDGFGTARRGSRGTVANGIRHADAMARVAGYANWAAMSGAMQPIMLLDKRLGVGLPHLVAKVKLADTWLRSRHKLDDQHPTWKILAEKKLQWNYTGNGAYAHDLQSIGQRGVHGGLARGPHLHAAGLALDIDPRHNPWVFTGGQSNQIMAKHMKWAASMYGGEEVTAKKLTEWSKQLSTEELFAKVDRLSKSLGEYLRLAETGSDKQIQDKFTDAGYTESEAKQNVVSVKRFGKSGYRDTMFNFRWFQDQMGRGDATGLTTHSMEMVVALRDVAGLAWGGTEMSEGENGDFMHFDCRNESIGQAILAFNTNNRQPEQQVPQQAPGGAPPAQ